jgi:DNA-binding NarL/FixJ family response regulator
MDTNALTPALGRLADERPAMEVSLNRGNELGERPVATKHRVAAVDDQESVLASLRYLLRTFDDFTGCGFYPTASEALVRIPIDRPQVVLMDIRLPDLCGIECTRQLKLALPELVVVMMTALEDSDTINRSIAAGCSGYLTKPFSASQCLATLRCALRHPGYVGARTNPMTFLSPATTTSILSESEHDLMRWLAHGLRYKEIADKVGLNQPLIHKRLQLIYRKLGATSRMEAVNRWRAMEPLD